MRSGAGSGARRHLSCHESGAEIQHLIVRGMAVSCRARVLQTHDEIAVYQP